MNRLLLGATVLVLALGAGGARMSSDAPGDDDASRRILQRLQLQLERNPRRGPTWERVFQQHLVRGSVETWLQSYRDRTAKDPRDGTAWMLVGLIEARRGRDDDAARAFEQAEKLRPDDPLPPFYLGELLGQAGRPGAAAALERAVARKPQGDDLLAAFRALARAYQQAHKPREALAAWDRLQKLRPDDVGIHEQIATALVEEGQFAEALPRFETLARSHPDRGQRPLFLLDAADLKARLERKDEALADYERLLGDLAPDHWLHREVVLRLEDVFLRNDDLIGLARYYEAWLKKKPDDVDAMARLARVLRQLGRPGDAKAWLTKALGRAPGNKNLRLALIEHLTGQKDFASAAAQYAELDRREPNQPDVLRAWGQLLLRDPARPEADRHRAAAQVWRRLADTRPNDPVAARQAAELFRQAEMTEEALAFYQRAVKLAPGDPQFREDLGEYYQALKRPREAQAAWQGLAEGKNRTAGNLARLAEIYANHDYLTEALRCLAEACALDKSDFFLHLKYAALLQRGGKHAEALRQAEYAGTLAGVPEERESALRQEILCLQSAGQLHARSATLRKQLETARAPSAESWYRLARYHEAGQEIVAAVAAVEKALARDPKSIPAWATAARLHEATGDLKAAADANRRLAGLDRRARTEYLAAVARLEARFGRTEEALKAGRELLLASPGNLAHHQFFADLCFQMGREKEGLDALRLALRANPNDPQALSTLAKVMADRFRAGEAIELYWQAFQRATRLEDKLAAVTRLSELHQQTNQMDALLTRLRPRRGDPSRQREQILCLAEAYRASGDLPRARQELDRLLGGDVLDRPLLRQLSQMAEQEGNHAAAVKYQRQVVELEPTREARVRLGSLLLAAGEAREATEQFLQAAIAERDPRGLLLATQHFLDKRRPAEARQIIARALDRHPDGWEGLYLDGVALMNLGQPAEAAKRFAAVLKQSRPDDELSILQQPGKAKAGQPGDHPLKDRAELVQTHILLAVGLIDPRTTVMRGGQAPRGFWSPADFGQARIACLGWLLLQARKEKREEALVERYRQDCDPGGRNTRAWWDWYYLALLRMNYRDMAVAGRALSRGPDLAGKWLYLGSKNYGPPLGGAALPLRLAAGLSGHDQILTAGEVEHVLACYQALHQAKPDWIDAAVLATVLGELRQAGRKKEETQLYRDTVRDARRPNVLQALYQAALQRDDLETMLAVEDRLAELKLPPAGGAAGRFADNELTRLLERRADRGAHGDVLEVLDHRLTNLRRRRSTGPPRATGGGNVQPANYRISLGANAWTYRPIDYPLPNEFFDADSVTLLREAFGLFQRDELVEDLLQHFRARLAVADKADQVFLRLALCYLHWWNNDRAEAVQEMAAACAAAPTEVGLHFELARLYEQQRQPALALAALDRIPIPNADLTRRREVQALKLALQGNNKARAKQAAERLFGLQLNTPALITLAGQMDQLGMKDEARTVLLRARRRPSASVPELGRLMHQLQAYQMTEAADQVAAQILRSTGHLAFPNPILRGPDDLQMRPLRQQAIALLSKSGRLKELIAQAEANVKALPRSVQAHQVLLDYYQAANERAKVRQTLETLARLNPGDATLRYRTGTFLAENGAAREAIPHFEAAFKGNPQLLHVSPQTVVTAYRQAKEVPALAKLLDGIDVSGGGGPSFQLVNLTASLLRAEDTKVIGWGLFRKVWKAERYNREYILSMVPVNQLEQMPRFEEFVRETLLPDTQGGYFDPWTGIVGASRFYSPGEQQGEFVTVVLLEAFRRRNKLEALAREIEETSRKRPDWKGGRALVALLHLRANRPTEARPILEELFKEQSDFLPAHVPDMLLREVEKHESLTPTAILLYERRVDDMHRYGNYYDRAPFTRLMDLYLKTGRNADGRAMCLKFTQLKLGAAEDYQYANRAQLLAQVGDYLIRLGYPVDALQLFQRLMADRRAGEAVSRSQGSSAAQTGWQKQVNEGFRKALAGLHEGNIPAVAQALLEPPKGKPAGTPVIDWAALLAPPEPERAELVSLPFTALRTAAANPALKGEITSRLARLAKERPDDLSLHIAAALIAVASDGPDAEESITRLVRRLEARPLPPLPPGRPVSGRLRAEAQGQVVLWLLARECYNRRQLQKPAEALGLRAVQAARRLQDRTYALVILREWGALDLARGDRAGAERRWSMLLEVILPHAASEPTAQASGGPKPLLALQAPAMQVTALAAPPLPTAPPSVREEQFHQAMTLAKLAAGQRMHSLSLRAVRAALAGGPPIPTPRPAVARPRTLAALPDEVRILHTVATQVAGLVDLWHADGVSPADVYEALAAVVMPQAVPGQVHLYPQELLLLGEQRPRSVGRLLAEAAVTAGKSDDLRRRLEGRQEQAALAARVGLAQLGLAAKEDRLLSACLEWLAGQPATADAVTLAIHAALPALRRAEACSAARAVLRRVSQETGAADDGTARGPYMRLALARDHFARKERAEGLHEVQAFVRLAEAAPTTTSGNVFLSPAYRQWHLNLATCELLRAGLLSEAMGVYAKYVAAPPMRASGGVAEAWTRYNENTGHSLSTTLAARLEATPPRRRYDLLRAFTFPAAEAKQVRVQHDYRDTDPPPPAFLPEASTLAGGPRRLWGIYSSADLLVEAAREAGKLDELKAEIEVILAGKDPRFAAGDRNALLLAQLLALRRGDGRTLEPALRAAADEIHPPPSSGRTGRGGYWFECELACQAGHDPAAGPAARELALGIARHYGGLSVDYSHLVSTMRYNAARGEWVRRGLAPPDRGLDPGLTLWHPGSVTRGDRHLIGAPPPCWVAEKELLCHHSGPLQDYLFFAYPLTGIFEFSVDAYAGRLAGGFLSYAGLVAHPAADEAHSGVSAAGGHETVRRPFPLLRAEGYHRLTVQVRPEKVRYLVNGKLFFEDNDPSPLAPWLALFAHGHHHTAFRNPRLRGEPVIPSQVRLTGGDRLDGWVAGYYSESQPRPRTARTPQAAATKLPPPAVSDLDWSARDGTLYGRRTLSVGQPDPLQSRLFYFRPLRPGESVRYAFFYRPGAYLVHPALDRLTFLLDPAGVRLHWMTDGMYNDVTGYLLSDNAVDEPKNRRGKGPLPLKADDWNQLRLSLKGNTAALELNGTLIYERELEPHNNRQFGFFHYKDQTAVKVRDVVLEGNWPKALTAEQLANLLAPAPARRGDAERQARETLLDEKFLRLEEGELLRLARALPAERAYERLLAATMPPERSATFRLHGALTPGDPPPAGPVDRSRPAARVHHGGQVESAALELVRLAKQLGRLDALAAAVGKVPAAATEDRRGQLALLVLIDAAQGRDADVSAGLTQLRELVARVPKLSPSDVYWPEVLAAVATLDRPKCRPAAAALLDELQGRFGATLDALSAHIVHLHGRAQAQALPLGPLPDAWAAVTHATAASRAAGRPWPVWGSHQGELHGYPGHGDDRLYLRVPLRGDFEFRGELRGDRNGRMQIGYGGMIFDLDPSGRSYQLLRAGQPPSSRAVQPALKLGEWYPFRLSVKAHVLTLEVAGRALEPHKLPAEHDPWLLLRRAGVGVALARNLELHGAPAVPERLALSASGDLSGWLASYYDEKRTGQQPAWEAKGDEIVGRRLDAESAAQAESVLQYHRPLLEDGLVRYEFFYEPSRTAVYPALDRLAFLLQPDGVGIHWLTDGVHDRSGLAADNATVEKENRRGPAVLPLKSGAWNKVEVALQGDTVTLRLNDVVVYERVLEPGNQRVFGLFRYADETAARVRKVEYHGGWRADFTADKGLWRLVR